MKNRWDQSFADSIAEDDLALRVYTSNLLGAEEDLVLHGGGNTSLKGTVESIFGKKESVMFVKGSGWDLRSIEKAGFPATRLDYLLKLSELDSLSDTEMMSQLRLSLINPLDLNPSVEAVLHALIPFKFVDHTHATPFLILANLPDAREVCRKIFGERLAIVPYIMPGFALAKKAAEIYEKNPAVEGLLLLNHGHFAFGETAKKSYQKIVEHTNQVAKYFKLKNPTSIGVRNNTKNIHFLPILRGMIANVNETEEDTMPVFDLRNNKNILNFFKRKDLNILEKRGMASPDHVLRTKGKPIFLSKKELNRNGISKKVNAFKNAYVKYFDRQVKKALEPKTILKADPKHAWIENLGVLGKR